MLKEYMTTTEAANYKGYTPEYVCYLCSKGKLQGVERIGKKMWIIPRKSIEEYKPGLQGQAAVNARKEAECRKLQEDFAAQGTPISPALAAAIFG